MFKKRGINSNKNQLPKQSINLYQELGNISISNPNNQQQISINNQTSNLNELLSKNKQEQVRNRMKTQDQRIQQKKQREDEQYLQRLQRDQKLQDLFNNLQQPSYFQDKREKQKTMISQKKVYINRNSLKQQLQKFQLSQQNQQPKRKIRNRVNMDENENELNKSDKFSRKKFNFSNYLKPRQSQPIQNKLNQYEQNKQDKNDKKGERCQQQKQIQDIFKQIRQQNIKQQQYQNNQQVQFNKINNQKPHTSHFHQPIKTNQFIIQDEDQYVQQIPKNQFVYSHSNNPNLYNQVNINQNNMLKVTVDYQGNLSPQLSQNQSNQSQQFGKFHQQDYQDQLIRKTLTKNNYQQLQANHNLKSTKLNHKKQKLLNSLLKTSWYQIQSKINSDINTKSTKVNQLKQQMRYLQERVNERSLQVDRKKVMLKQLHKQQLKMKKVIYFLSYFGDQLYQEEQSIIRTKEYLKNKQSIRSKQIQTFFNDLTINIIDKIIKLADKVNIQEFMQKQRSRQELRDKYKSGRKKIKKNNNQEGQQQVVQQCQQQDEDDDGEFYMEDDDNY